MVQYVFTPWRDRQELLLVRGQFYGAAATTASLAQEASNPQQSRGGFDNQAGGTGRGVGAAAEERGGGDRDDAAAATIAASPASAARQQGQNEQRRRDQHQAVARVSMWMQRGHCPHMVESTALLMAAVLSDEETPSSLDHSAASTTYALRAAYSAAFSRFVTGLLDSHQEKQHKQSMYSIAKTIGLPATFVELRHQSTHEQLPSRAKLRSAAVKALDWIWDYYWKHLKESEDGRDERDTCAEAVLSYLNEDDEARRRKALNDLHRWDQGRLLRTIAHVQKTLPGNQAYLKCAKLSQEIKDGSPKHNRIQGAGDLGSDNLTQAPWPSDQDHNLNEAGRRDGRDAVEPPAEQDPDSGLAGQAPELDTGWSRYEGPWIPKPIGLV